MKKIVTTLVLSSFVLFMVNCSPKIGAEVTKGPVPTAEQMKAEFSASQLEQGKMIWQSNCNKCHKLFEPGMRTPEKWNSILRKMIPKAKLNLNDAQLVRAYLIANSQAS